MEYLIHDGKEILGMRGSIPTKEENLQFIELNDENQAIYENCKVAGIINGKIVDISNAIVLTPDEIESKIADLKEQMGKELAVTDWYYIRRLETLEEVPKEIQEERTSIREKYEVEINNLTK